MPLPPNTATACQFLLGMDAFPADDQLSVSSSGGVISIDTWDATALGRAEPTEQELNDAVNDVTTVSGQTFSQWVAEHGGDATLTQRRLAKLEILAANKPVLRAIVLTLLDEVNTLRAQHSLAARTPQQALDAIAAKITAGDAD